MGILDRLGLSTRKFDALRSTVALDIRSPWISGEDKLTTIAVAKALLPDGADLTAFPLSRTQALQVPAVSKARNLLISTITRFPLRALDRTGLVDPQPTFLYRTDGPDSPYERLVATIDDLIFDGRSLWLLDRGAGPSPAGGPVLNATWCHPKNWKITDGNVLVNDQQVSPTDYLLINVPNFPGLLSVADRTLRGARDTEEAWTARMKNPIAAVNLKIDDEDALPEGVEISDFVDEWKKAFTAPGAAVGYTPAGVTMTVHSGSEVADLFLENRNAVRTDVGSFVNIRAAMLDGTTGVDSLTYTTKDGEKNSFYELDLPFWTAPIEAALSGDNIVPRGQRVRFDKYEVYGPTSPTGPIEED